MMQGPIDRHDGRTFHPWLVTHVTRITYDYARQVGVVDMPSGCSTDMAGAIALFTRLDPQVREIQTYAGDLLDTVYVREPRSARRGPHWRARLRRVRCRVRRRLHRVEALRP